MKPTTFSVVRKCIGLFFLLPATAAVASHAAPAGVPAVWQVLDRYEATQRQTYRSFISRFESENEGYINQHTVLEPGHRKGRDVVEIRSDGQRYFWSEERSGQCFPALAQTTPATDPRMKRFLFDGQWGYHYEQPYWRIEDIPNGQLGTGTLTLRHLSPPPTDLIEALQFCGSAFMIGLGVLPHDGQRIDVRLREASSLRVRDQQELAGWMPSLCVVIEAETAHGHYTVWLDPARNHQMAKGILERQAGHRRGSWTLKNNERDLSCVEKVRFAKSGDLWVPVELDASLENTFSGGYRSSMRSHFKITRFLPNPDHAALNSFVPDDIRNGAKVYYPNNENRRPGTWRDGQVVNESGTVILTLSPRFIELRKERAGTLPATSP